VNARLTGSALALATAATLGLAGCGSHTTAAAPSAKATLRQNQKEQASKAAITVAAQKSSGFTVMVTSVTLPEGSAAGASPGTGGVVALAPDVGGKPGDVLGFSKVSEGTSRRVRITLAVKLDTGRYFVMLYPGADVPASGGQPLATAPVVLTVSS
jgi:hypothetical protein